MFEKKRVCFKVRQVRAKLPVKAWGVRGVRRGGSFCRFVTCCHFVTCKNRTLVIFTSQEAKQGKSAGGEEDGEMVQLFVSKGRLTRPHIPGWVHSHCGQ